jgi:DNA repair protein RadC
MIRDLPVEERPRERLARYGAEALSTPELLAILLRTGTKQESAVRVAERLMCRFQNLKNLSNSAVEEIASERGLGQIKAIGLKAALELGKRLAAYTDEARPTIRSAQDVVNLLMADMRHLPREEFRVLMLKTKNQVIAIRTVTSGTLNASLVHPREVFREAIIRASNSVICVHNHPSGDPTPSAEDLEITKRLVEAGKLLGIEMLDHVIMGDGRSVSMREKDLM